MHNIIVECPQNLSRNARQGWKRVHRRRRDILNYQLLCGERSAAEEYERTARPERSEGGAQIIINDIFRTLDYNMTY